jgi:hypothetical protein
MANNTTTYSQRCSLPTPICVLPTELWLDILGEASIPEAEHLWMSARHTSRKFRDNVERLFATTYLPQFAISLALPRRDPVSGAAKWPGAVLNAQIVMAFESIDLDNRYVNFVSTSHVKAADDVQTMAELRDKRILPKQRLEEAKAWVFIRNYMSGVTLQLPRHIEWDEQGKRWKWQLDWRKFVTRFYTAKTKARHKKRVAQARR